MHKRSSMLRARFFALIAALTPAMAVAAWQVVATEQGKQVEIDRESIVAAANGSTVAKGRIVLDKPIADPKTSDSYRIIEVESRYNCAERTHSTLKRSYYKEEGVLLRQEEVRGPLELPVRSGTPDYSLFRAACRPNYKGEEAISAAKAADQVNAIADELRKLNEAQIAAAVHSDHKKSSRAADSAPPARGVRPAKRREPTAAAVATPSARWSYAGSGGPEQWGQLKPDYATCGRGRLQSPIDLRDGIAVDLEPIVFDYRPALFRVADSGRNLQLTVFGGGFSLLGKKYQLTRVQLHRPSEFTVDGRVFAMEAQLEHRAEDGRLAVVSVLLEPGAENPVLQAALNNLPLARGGEVTPPGQRIDLAQLLPDNGQYFTFIGSLTTPPCTEDVLWLVMKQAQAVSAEQLAIFQRLYSANARPVQPAFARIVKESR